MAYIYRSNSSASGTTATISAWVKSVDTSVDAGVFQFKSSSNTISFYTNPVLKFRVYTSGGYSTGDLVANNRKFRDFGGWWHLVATIDTTNVTSGDRLRVYINGERHTDYTTETYPSKDQSYAQLVSGNFELGKYSSTDRTTYLAHVHYCDGYAYNADSFGSTDATTGQWKINTQPNVQYGSNGVFLKFASAGALGTDSSGNNNTMSISGTALQTQDNPSNNFCTWNANKKMTVTLSNGNTTTSGNGDNGAWGTIGDNQGKWYWETQQNAGNTMMGILHEDVQQTTGRSDQAGVYGVQDGTTYAYYRNNGSSGQSSGFAQITNSAVLCHALDLDNGKYYLGVNGSFTNLSGTASDISAGTNPTFSGLDTTKFWFPFTECRGNGAGCDANFGNGFLGTTAISSAGTNASNLGNFEYDVPAGFTAWCTKGLNE
jgi:hypothetical protein